MEKPKSVSMKDWIIRGMSVKDMVSERVIEAVINHAFEEAHKALKDNFSIEISGFGRFYYKRNGARMRLASLYHVKDILEARIADVEGVSLDNRNRAKGRMVDLLTDIEILKTKVDEDIASVRRVEESVAATEEVKEGDREGIPKEEEGVQ